MSPRIPAPATDESPPWMIYHRFGLTRRESEVLWWIAQGKRDREIAVILGVSVRTIHFHVRGILEKFGVETRTAALAQLHRLLLPPS